MHSCMYVCTGKYPLLRFTLALVLAAAHAYIHKYTCMHAHMCAYTYPCVFFTLVLTCVSTKCMHDPLLRFTLATLINIAALESQIRNSKSSHLRVVQLYMILIFQQW